MNENEKPTLDENFKCVADIVEACDLSYHVGKVIDNLLRIEIALTKSTAENLAEEAKELIDRYVKYQWKKAHS